MQDPIENEPEDLSLEDMREILNDQSIEPMSREELQELFLSMEFAALEQRRRQENMQPVRYGCPDLLFPIGFAPGRYNRDTFKIERQPLPYEETEEQFEDRQNNAIYDMVTKKLTIPRDGKIQNILLIPEAAKMIADLFFERERKIILWGPRGGGKSLLAAVVLWLFFVYKQKSCLNMGGAGNQARRVYDYTKQFWQNFPGMQKGMLARDPLLQLSELRSGSKLICATSVSSAIGEHVPIFVCDEACTDRHGADHDLMRAMQGALSEEGHSILLLSTFHLPIGFFADVWESADELGFKRVKWDCFSIMKPCTAGLEYSTRDDPGAVETFCKVDCSLTWKDPVRDEFGTVTGHEWRGCVGKARKSKGWMSREQVLDEQRLNKGTRIFIVEHACYRPHTEGRIYNRTLIDKCVHPTFNLFMDRPKVIGIDWGLEQSSMVIIGEWFEGDLATDPDNYTEGVGVIDIVFMSNKLVDTVVDQIIRWQEIYGDDVSIRADGSHPYNNKELATHGYSVKPVYGDKKRLGEDNMARWIGSGHLKILAGFDLFVTQLHNLRRNVMTGKQMKKNLKGEKGDHGPDACKFALMDFSFIAWSRAFLKRKSERYKEVVNTRNPYPKRNRRRSGGLDGMLT